jgi:hypothetical protein
VLSLTAGANNDLQPHVAMDAGGDFVVTWQARTAQLSATATDHVFAQAFAASGTAQSGAMLVSTDSTLSDENPAVAMDAAGNFVIDWQSAASNAAVACAFARRYSAGGTPRGNPFQVNTSPIQENGLPLSAWMTSVAVDASGDFVITWSSNATTGDRILAQRFDHLGTPVAGEFQVNSYTADVQLAPVAAMDAAGDFVISWSSLGQDGDGYGVYANRYAASGNSVVGPFRVNITTKAGQDSTSVAMDAGGDFGIAWTDFSLSPAGNPTAVNLRLYDSALTPAITLAATAIPGALGTVLTNSGQLAFVNPDLLVTMTTSIGTVTVNPVTASWAWSYLAAVTTSPMTVTLTATAGTQTATATFTFTVQQATTLVGDVNRDGKADLVTFAPDGTWLVALSTGSSFVQRAWAQWSSPDHWQAVFVTDVNGDGRDDIVGFNRDGSWWVGISTGTHFVTSLWSQWSTADHWAHVAVGDFTADGKSDIVGFSHDGSWWVGASTGNRFTTSMWSQWSTPPHWRSIQVGDVTGEGRDDIVGFNNDGSWWVGASTGSHFTTSLRSQWSTADHWDHVAVGDFTGDGKIDIVGFDYDGSWWVGASTGSSFATSLWSQWSNASHWRDLVVGDFNGDGKDDIGAFNYDGSWWIGLSSNHAFHTSLWVQWLAPSTWATTLVGNFDGRFGTDIAGLNSDGSLWVGLTNGKNAFVDARWL